MKNKAYIYNRWMTIVCLSFVISVLSFSSATAQKSLTILHTNDTHSCIMPIKKTMADKTMADRGGFLRRINMIKEERKTDPTLLLFDSGDFSQGSTYYTMFKGDVEIGLMNEMRYDAVTIGNHEFDFGWENMARLFKMANFPVVCSNYDFADTELAEIVKPYIVIKRNGIKIGVFGLCPKLEGLVSKKNFGPLTYLDPTEAAQKMINLLRNEKKCDLIICLSHLGYKISDYPCDKVIRETSGIDLVLDGHTHTYLEHLEYVKDKSGRMVPIEQNGKSAIYVGKMKLTLDKK